MSADDGRSEVAASQSDGDAEAAKKRGQTRVLVTRSRRGPGRLKRQLEEAGFFVVSVPTIEFRTVESTWMTDLLEPAEPWELTIFTSRTTLDFLVENLGSDDLSGYARTLGSIAAVGPSTARKLGELGLSASHVPETFDAEGLVEALRDVDIAGRRVALPRAVDARAVLPEWLRGQGAELSVIDVYESYRPDESVAMLRGLEPSDIDVVTFASSNTARYFDGLLDEDTAWMRDLPCACIGPVTQATADSLGYRSLSLPQEFSFDALVAVLKSWRTDRS